MEINARIARRVRELRDARGYSLDALAERSGVSRSNISLTDTGKKLTLPGRPASMRGRAY